MVWYSHLFKNIPQFFGVQLYQKDLNDPVNHDGVITHLEPDTLGFEVKWSLGNITKNKAHGGDGIPVELFQVLKVDAVRQLHSVCHQYFFIKPVVNLWCLFNKLI